MTDMELMGKNKTKSLEGYICKDWWLEVEHFSRQRAGLEFDAIMHPMISPEKNDMDNQKKVRITIEEID